MENEENHPPDNLGPQGTRPRLYYFTGPHRLSYYNALIYKQLKTELENNPALTDPEAILDRLIEKFGPARLPRLIGRPPQEWRALLNRRKWEKTDPV
jgi:hypothetical protein